MHTVFLVDEIFKIICDNAASTGGPASLAALAQTCRSLEGISLDVLWGQGQVDLFNILGTFPTDSWSATETSFVRSHLFCARRTNAEPKRLLLVPQPLCNPR